MGKELEEFENKCEEKYKMPAIHKMESKNIREATTIAKATKDNEPLFKRYIERLNF